MLELKMRLRNMAGSDRYLDPLTNHVFLLFSLGSGFALTALLEGMDYSLQDKLNMGFIWRNLQISTITFPHALSLSLPVIVPYMYKASGTACGGGGTCYEITILPVLLLNNLSCLPFPSITDYGKYIR